jgi:gliding motility-associated-like protein
MKYCLLTIVFLFLVSARSQGQNYVPNPSFEIYTGCPWNLLSMPFSKDYTAFPTVQNWTNPAKYSSPDYLNQCAPVNSGMNVPGSTFGYQAAVSGNAYAGIIAWEGMYINGSFNYDYREYIQTQLTQPLIAGKQYCISFHVSPTISPAFNLNYSAIDELGANLSVQRPVDTLKNFMSLPYHVESDNGTFFNDTSKWYRIKNAYTATGGESWLTLGCFNNSSNPPAFQNLYPQVPNNSLPYWSYLFIDEVSVTEITSADSTRIVHDTTVCQASGLSISLSPNTDAVGYVWNNGQTSSQILVNDTGTYWCISRVQCGLVTDTFHINYQPFKKLDLGKDKVNCLNQPVQISSNYPYSTYTWSTGALTSSITVTQTGSYILTVTDICGIQKDTINVIIQPPTPAPLASDTILCQFSPAPQLIVSGSNIKWYQSPASIGSSAQPYLNTYQPGIQTVYLSQTIGACESPRVPVNVTIRYKPNADIGNYITLCKGTDTLIGHTYPDVFYIWNTNEQVCCIRPTHTGTYTLTITNDCGTSTDTAFVEMSMCDECVFLPNAFTPNSDNVNDAFRALLKCPVNDFHLDIYNRWGENLFSSDETGEGWNGKYRGDNCSNGVYVYVLSYRSVNTGRTKKLTGNLTLIR